MVKDCTHKNTITVDPLAACVSYEQSSCCIVFSFSGAPRLQVAHVRALPPSFIGVEQAQQVCRDAREIKFNQIKPPPATAPQLSRLRPPHTLLLQLRRTVSLVINAAAACLVFRHQSARTHYLQPPPQLGFKLSQRLLELASVQPCCRGGKQRLLLMCRCSPLSNVAIRLACEVGRECRRSLHRWAIARIIARCLAFSATQL
jgi:hypothetical protein